MTEDMYCILEPPNSSQTHPAPAPQLIETLKMQHENYETYDFLCILVTCAAVYVWSGDKYTRHSIATGADNSQALYQSFPISSLSRAGPHCK